MIRGSRITLIVLVLAGVSTSFAADIRMRDLDGDGYREAFVWFEAGRAVRAVADRDQDGYAEAAYFYSDGRRDRAEIDLDQDGRTDQWFEYDSAGGIRKAAYDFDGDGKSDYWMYYKNGVVYKWEQDRNADGRPDMRTYYEETVWASKPVFRQALDQDYDGDFESLSRGSQGIARLGVPHSLAEALLGTP